jgi:hypothetical protein
MLQKNNPFKHIKHFSRNLKYWRHNNHKAIL